MRGKGVNSIRSLRTAGITPAHAGKSQLKKPVTNLIKDHPRACGEKFNRIAKPFREQGSPPRMRGKAKRNFGKNIQSRITPAHAGKSDVVRSIAGEG